MPPLQVHAVGDLADGAAVYLDDATLYDEATANVERGNLAEPYTHVPVFYRDLPNTSLKAPNDQWLAGEMAVESEVVGLVAFVTGYSGASGVDYYDLTLQAKNIVTDSDWETVLTLAQVEDATGNVEVNKTTTSTRAIRAGEIWRLKVTQTGSPIAGAPSATDGLHVLIVFRQLHQGGRDG